MVGAATVTVGPGDEEQLAAVSAGEHFDVVFDATGNPKAMERGFRFVAHAGSYVLISVVGAPITFSDPEFHKREMMLIGSRNATRIDFDHVRQSIAQGLVPIDQLVTHRTTLDDLADDLPRWAREKSGLIKALIQIG